MSSNSSSSSSSSSAAVTASILTPADERFNLLVDVQAKQIPTPHILDLEHVKSADFDNLGKKQIAYLTRHTGATLSPAMVALIRIINAQPVRDHHRAAIARGKSYEELKTSDFMGIITPALVGKLVKYQYGCNACRDSLVTLLFTSGSTGPVIFTDAFMESKEFAENVKPDDPDYPYYQLYHAIAYSAVKSQVSEIVIVKNEEETAFGFPPTKMSPVFKHWHLPISAEFRTSPGLPEKATDIITKVIQRYILVERKFKTILDEALKIGNENIEMMLSIVTGTEEIRIGSEVFPALPQAAYGHKLIGPTKWIQSIVTDLQSKGKPVVAALSQVDMFNLVVPHLLKSPIGKDECSGAVALFVDTTDQVIELLTIAKGMKAMYKLIEGRFHPDRYKQKTAEAKMQTIERAMGKFGDYSNSVMTVDEMAKYCPTVKISSVAASSVAASNSTTSGGAASGGAGSGGSGSGESVPLTGFARQLAEKAAKKDGGFASRCKAELVAVSAAAKEAERIARIRALTTVEGVFEYCLANPARVELYTPGVIPLVYYTTTLNPEFLCVNYLWGFYNRSNLKDIFGITNSWTNVSHIGLGWKNKGRNSLENNVIFACSDIKTTASIGNCNQKSFLTTEYEKSLGGVFMLNNKDRPIIPRDCQLVAGGGFGAPDGVNLCGSVILRIDGVEISITKLY